MTLVNYDFDMEFR